MPLTREQIKVGQRVKFTENFDSYPFIPCIAAGSKGIIVSGLSDPDEFFWISMDVKFRNYDQEMWSESNWPKFGVEICTEDWWDALEVFEGGE